MNRKWQNYEEEVYEECCRIYGDENVDRNVSKVGVSSQVPRQIDVLVHSEEGDIAYDAKYYSKRVDVKTIEAMIGMYGDLGVEKFVVVTNKGYSKAALRRAHLGKDNVEADVLSIGELKRMQGYWAMPYAGRNCIMLVPPFGWIIDGQKSAHPGMSTVLYRRGVDQSDGALFEINEPITRWRVFNRSVNYENHLHVILDDSLCIYGFLHDYMRNDRDKVMGAYFEGNKKNMI